MLEIVTLIVSLMVIVISLWIIMKYLHQVPLPLLREAHDHEPLPLNRWTDGHAPLVSSPPALNLHLVTQWYQDEDPTRQAEIDYCFRHHRYFDKVIVLVTQGEQFPWTDKQFKVITTSSHRPTFGELWEVARRYATSETVTLIANSDIVFDQTVELLRFLPSTHAVALARWNIDLFAHDETDLSECHLQHDPFSAQDVWAVRGHIPVSLTQINYSPGVIGCDHALALALTEAGYRIFNPALTVRSYHVHTVDTRQDINKQPLGLPGLYIPVLPWSVL